MLTKKLANQTEEEKKTFEIYKKFAERMNEIEKIFNLLTKIAEKGYSEDIQIEVEIKEGTPKFYSQENDEENIFKDYEECIKYLNGINKKTHLTQIN